jgi:hypothetical protein
MRIEAAAIAMSAILVAGLAGSALGQQRTPPAPTAVTMDDVVNELRALRTEFKEASAASLRAQLLVARLQLQEQRITTVWRQLSEVDDKLRANENGRMAPEQALKLMGVEPGAEPPKEMGPIVEMFRNQMEASAQSDSELKLRQAELTQLIAQEQSRWNAYNAQLEALEKAVTAIAPRR